MKTVQFDFEPVYSGIHDTIYRCEKGEDHSGEYVKKDIADGLYSSLHSTALELQEVVTALERLVDAAFENNCISIASQLYAAKNVLDKYKSANV